MKRLTKKDILDKVLFIETHTEYIAPEEINWNELQQFVADHYEEAQKNYESEMWKYCDDTIDDIY